MDNNLCENIVKIETPVETAVQRIARSVLSIIVASLLLLCSVALDVFSLNNHIATALLMLYAIAVYVGAGLKSVSFKKAAALTSFIIFTVVLGNHLLHLLFPNNNFVIFSKGSFKLMLLPEADFLGAGGRIELSFLTLLAVYFLLKFIADSHLKSAVKKNLPLRGGHITCGVFMCILSIASVYLCASLFLTRLPTRLILPDNSTYTIMYTVAAVFGGLAVAFVLEAIVCFRNFSKLRKIENAF